MIDLRYTLLADGSSDDALLPILTWLLRVNGVEGPIQPTYAELRFVPELSRKLGKRITTVLELYPCDLLFIHRDAEKEPPTVRVEEIRSAVEALKAKLIVPPVVCVVPVQMTEAWLLFDENAIRRAAGNPNGTVHLNLPGPSFIEKLLDPKEEFYEKLRLASGLKGRRLKQFLNKWIDSPRGET